MKELLIALVIWLPTTCLCSDFTGSWKGNFVYNGSGWPMRIHVLVDGENLAVQVDFPSLMMAGEPITSSERNDTLTIDFPFGIGQIPFVRVGDQLIPQTERGTPIMQQDETPPYEIQPITWQSGKSELHGSIYLPRNTSKPPLLIRIHGSAQGSRDNWGYRSWADYFARKGIASVVFDKRGSRDSIPNIRNDDFGILSEDVMNLLDHVKANVDIDTSRIILNGASQASYIASMVTAERNDVDFLLLTGASAISLTEQERYSLEFRMRAAGEPQSLISEALGYQHLYFHYVMTGKNWLALEVAARNAETTSWASFTDQPIVEEHLSWWRNNFDAFVPALHIASISIPTLLIYGADDAITPPVIMTPFFERYFDQESHTEYEIVICPNVGHNLELAFGTDRWGNTIFPAKSPVMFDAIERWLNEYDLTRQN